MAQSWEIDRKNQDLLTATRREMGSRALLGPEIQNSPFPLCLSISRLVGIVAWRFPSVRAHGESPGLRSFIFELFLSPSIEEGGGRCP